MVWNWLRAITTVPFYAIWVENNHEERGGNRCRPLTPEVQSVTSPDPDFPPNHNQQLEDWKDSAVGSVSHTKCYHSTVTMRTTYENTPQNLKVRGILRQTTRYSEKFLRVEPTQLATQPIIKEFRDSIEQRFEYHQSWNLETGWNHQP